MNLINVRELDSVMQVETIHKCIGSKVGHICVCTEHATLCTIKPLPVAYVFNSSAW